jgi:hypothetical protein
MLRRVILAIIVLGAAGLVVGYLIFARTTSGYLSLKSLVSPARNVIDDLVKNVAGIPQIRQSILICGAVGGGIGLVGAAVAGGGRRRRR